METLLKEVLGASLYECTSPSSGKRWWKVYSPLGSGSGVWRFDDRKAAEAHCRRCVMVTLCAMKELNLSEVPPSDHDKAETCFMRGDGEGLVYCAWRSELAFVCDNIGILRLRGIYEEALLCAFTAPKINFHNWRDTVIRYLFEQANRHKLRELAPPPVGEEFVLYRGISGHGRARRKFGISWTGSLDVACWFALRLCLAHPHVLTTVARRDEVLAYTNDGREDEYLIFVNRERTKRLKISTDELRERAERRYRQMQMADYTPIQEHGSGEESTPIVLPSQERNRAVIAAIRNEYTLPHDGDHGVAHWARVLENGLRLAEATGANVEVVQLFALFHDSKRLNEFDDPHHGRRGAEFAAELRGKVFDLSDHEFDLLYTACAEHTDGCTHSDITIQTCWDSDRLDLRRVGITPDPSRLCTEAARDSEMMKWANGRASNRVIPEFVRSEWGITTEWSKATCPS